MKNYEGLILFDNTVATDWAAMTTEVNRLMERAHATVHVMLKYDERKLAYEIRGKKRGTYVLCYFDAPPEKMTDLERDALLTESVLRFMFLRIEPLSEAKLAELKAHPAEQPLKPMSSGEGRRDDHHHGRGDRGGYGGGYGGGGGGYGGGGGGGGYGGGGGRREGYGDDALTDAGVDALADR